MFPSSRPPPHVDPAAASPGSPPHPSPPRQPVLPGRWWGLRLPDGGDEAGAGVPASRTAAPRGVGRPQPPPSTETLSPPRRPSSDGGRCKDAGRRTLTCGGSAPDRRRRWGAAEGKRLSDSDC